MSKNYFTRRSQQSLLRASRRKAIKLRKLQTQRELNELRKRLKILEQDKLESQKILNEVINSKEKKEPIPVKNIFTRMVKLNGFMEFISNIEQLIKKVFELF